MDLESKTLKRVDASRRCRVRWLTLTPSSLVFQTFHYPFRLRSSILYSFLRHSDDDTPSSQSRSTIPSVFRSPKETMGRPQAWNLGRARSKHPEEAEIGSAIEELLAFRSFVVRRVRNVFEPSPFSSRWTVVPLSLLSQPRPSPLPRSTPYSNLSFLQLVAVVVALARKSVVASSSSSSRTSLVPSTRDPSLVLRSSLVVLLVVRMCRSRRFLYLLPCCSKSRRSQRAREDRWEVDVRWMFGLVRD